jgi:hypothetical protein
MPIAYILLLFSFDRAYALELFDSVRSECMILGVLQQDVCLRHYFTKNKQKKTPK